MNHFRIVRRMAAPLLTLLLLPFLLLTFARETQATNYTFKPVADPYVSGRQPNDKGLMRRGQTKPVMTSTSAAA